MKASTIIINSLLLAAGLAAPAASLARRDLAAIQGALKNVEDGLGKVKTAVQGLNGNDINSGTPILSVSDALSKTIKQATTDIQGSQELSLQDALSLQQSSGALITAAQDTVSALTAKKAALDQLGVTQIAVTTLKQQKTDSSALGKALVSKIPAIGQGIAQQSIDQIDQTLDKGITALSAAPAGGAAAPAAPAGGANGGAGANKGNGTTGGAPKPAEPKPAEPAAPKPAEPATPKPAEPAAPKPAEPATPKPAEPSAAPKPAAGNNNGPLGAILGLLGQGNGANGNANGNPVTALLGAAGGAKSNKAGANAAANPLAALTGRAAQ
ncbi:hypothetical protein RB595_001461 [Gaeumannomyces hyphopodioides]